MHAFLQREGSGACGTRRQEKVVVAGNDDVGDFKHFEKRFLGLRKIPAVGENLAGEEMGTGGNGVAGDQRGAGGLADEQSTLAGGVSGQRIKIDAFSDDIGSGLDTSQQRSLFLNQRIARMALMVGGFFGGVEGGIGGVDLILMHPPRGLGEMLQAAAMHGTPVGEEYLGDGFGLEAGTFIETG